LSKSLKAKENELKTMEHTLKNTRLDSAASEKSQRERETALNQKVKELQTSLDA
jgi:hypothetical protein